MPTLEQIQAKLKKLQAQADVLIARKAQAAVDQIRELMLKHGLTTADIESQAKARRTARSLNGAAKAAGATKAARTATPAKYRNPETGATWTGHGRAPGWIASAKDRASFLIDGASETKSAAAPAKRGKGQPKGAQPPKYLNPKTGATWSGRGPAPAWLASVKDRTRFLIDSAAAAAAPKATKAAAKTGKGKSAASKKTAAKKAGATRKTAAKKATAKKATAKKAAAKKTPAASRKVAVKKTVARKGAMKTARKAPVRKAAAKSSASASAAPQAATVEASA
ncbi:H-NS histone family protein [Paraburkholderia susongensis]|uniref:DNA-binding protein H-NS n=1 Tax=Paraburkholderia susongensis TaxID=1515439 RepID=A0A1X7LCE2_9BURK|nr:H-NS family nucleoid-associated regulatory protein [Paraburkholderia susongensis]SMG51164.1 DNA-binding protein H-NS [Paraburkholderia susongensis]